MKCSANGPSLYLALVHHPVLNRRGDTIAAAVTNLDLHDLARLACTYDLPACYVITPLEDQQDLVRRLLSHWCEGVGKELHPNREEALRRLRVVESIAAAREDIASDRGVPPVVWATSARSSDVELGMAEARRRLAASRKPLMMLVGTGWGLAGPVIEEADAVVAGIRGRNGYNHLSVRCAAAILVDRLLGRE